MGKIRIPRKQKKRFSAFGNMQCFPYTPKIQRFWSYFLIENGISRYNLSAEELYYSFGRYTMDDVVWWHWVRKTYMGIEPSMSKKFQEYWDFFKKCKVI